MSIIVILNHKLSNSLEHMIIGIWRHAICQDFHINLEQKAIVVNMSKACFFFGSTCQKLVLIDQILYILYIYKTMFLFFLSHPRPLLRR